MNTVRIAATGTNHATNQSRIVELRVQATEKGQTMTTVRIADLIDKDVTGIRCDIRGGRHSEVAAPMVRVLTRCVRRLEPARRSKGKEPWIYLYWKPEDVTPEGKRDCGYSGWQEEHFKELDPVIILSE